jgi:hypothetical protein
MDTGTRTGIVYLANDGSDPVTAYRTSIRNLAAWAEAQGALYAQGLLSARPTAGKAGRLYRATDDSAGIIYYDDGSTWQSIGTSSAVDAAAGVGSLRTLGAGALQAAAGNHTHAIGAITGAGGAASLNVGTTAGTVAAGDHTHSLFIQKTADTSRTSTTTLADDPHLVLTLAASGTYVIRAAITFSAQATPMLKMNFRIGTGVTFKAWNMLGPDNTTGAFAQGSNVSVGGNVVNPNDVATRNGSNFGGAQIFYHDIVVTTAASGTYTFAFQWAQSTSNATASIVTFGSYLLAEKIA